MSPATAPETQQSFTIATDARLQMLRVGLGPRGNAAGTEPAEGGRGTRTDVIADFARRRLRTNCATRAGYAPGATGC